MGHSVGNAAERAVSKSVKAEAVKARTDEQIFRDMERNLDASLSVPPLDIRLLLKRYCELATASKTVAQIQDETIVEYPVPLPPHVGETVVGIPVKNEEATDGGQEKEPSGS